MDSEGEEEVVMCVGEAGHPQVYLPDKGEVDSDHEEEVFDVLLL